MASSTRQPQGLPHDHPNWSGQSSVFLRNVPARCTHHALSAFFRGLGLDTFQLEMARFRNGKSRGYGRVLLPDEAATREFVEKVHGQCIPGFEKQKSLTCEPFMRWQQQQHDEPANSEAQLEGEDARTGELSSHSTCSPNQTSLQPSSEST